MKQVTVLTASKSAGISKGLTYGTNRDDITIGTAVQVPLRNRLVEGIVLDVLEQRSKLDFDLKEIHHVLGLKALLSPAHLQTLKWMANYYCCSERQALRAFLPAPPWLDLYPQDQVTYTKIADEAVRGKLQIAVLEYLSSGEARSWDEIRSATGATKVTMNTLVTKGILEEGMQKEEIEPAHIVDMKRPTLTATQSQVYKEISTSSLPSLLFGITSSGKTEIYAQLIADVIAQGKQAIVLVPEILLTEHTIHRFSKYIDERYISILHSKITPAAKKAQWKRIHQGQVKLVLGSRSALFAPCADLGIVIIDEEHEWTYKNEQTPRYHARETAEALCKFAGAKLVLGSATPSVESWYRAKQGKYTLHRMPDRYGDNALPDVQIVDLADVTFGKLYPFSPTLLQAVQDRLERKEQSVLFLNRRGLATSLLCLDCRRRVTSPESQLPFTVHTRNGVLRLEDHTTGVSLPVPDTCPACQSVRLRPIGAGTERIEEILRAQFPKARILRADSDTIAHPEEIRSLLDKMKHNEADILLGTQSVVKGLDLPNVTLSAVVLADVGLSLPHFRAGERIFQLMTQLAGRSGRAKPGEVIIQTFRPDAPEIKLAALHQTEEFLEMECKMREFAKYPPMVEMFRCICREDSAKSTAERIQKQLEELRTTHGTEYAVYCSPTLFGAGKVWQVLVKGVGVHTLCAHIHEQGVVIDVDPIDCLS